MSTNMKKMSFILIPEDITQEIQLIESPQDEAWNKLRSLIGYIESVTLPSSNDYAPLHQLCFDEDAGVITDPVTGKLKASVNDRASRICGFTLLGDVAILKKPVIAPAEDPEEDEELLYYPLDGEVYQRILASTMMTDI